jgi:hypothetical protein
MNTLIRRCAGRLGLALALAALSGCTSLDSRTLPYVGAPTYPPTNPAQVELLRTPPTRAHDRLGEVSVRASVDPAPPMEKIEGALKQRAANLGAEAVLIVHDGIQPVAVYAWGPWWSPSLSTIPGRIVVGIAIRYR